MTTALTPPATPGRSGGFTRRLAGTVAAMSSGSLPPAIVERARQGVLDYIGVAVAGSTEPGARISQQLVAEDGSGPTSTVLGTGLRSRPAGAALCKQGPPRTPRTSMTATHGHRATPRSRCSPPRWRWLRSSARPGWSCSRRMSPG